MSRYIDADKLQKDGWKLRREKHGLLTNTYETMELDCVLTDDVVEVVRCKDCIYGEVDNADFPDQYFCNHHGCDWNDKNHFCSYGEREDNG